MSQWPLITDIAVKVQSGELKAVDLVEQALATIDAKKEFEAIIATVSERARERAAEIDERVARGEAIGRLAGVPFIAKDNFLTFGSQTTAASNILKGFEAPYQATAIEKLEAEGAIVVAKANLDAFAHGSSTENSDYMTTKNPHDMTRVPGGSSGGSAAAVVLDMAPFALGTDTGGSIRLPAAFTGSVGLKPTYGLVSRSGVVAMASSTDVVGPITRNVDDAAIVLDVMSGRDELDSTMIDRNELGYANLEGDLAGKKIGVIKEYMGEGLDPEVKAQIESAIDKLKVAGVEVKEVSLPSLPLALACYYIICPAEVSSNLSRYDGQRYGFSHPEAGTLEESYNKSRSAGFGNEAKRRIMIGTYVLSSGYYDAYYRKAQLLRTKLTKEFEAAFSDVDLLLGPTAPVTAFEIGANVDDPLQMYLTDIMTVAVNLVGVPAISIPAGTVNGLPVGLQLIAPMKKDRELLNAAKTTERIIE
ncbi:MAG: glutamyl-tRNA(Gln) and/or aspartyl-tRNA(Asn) amidotransferase, subunit [Candidatus Saccharibacteria bacterium]|nr:glutamyl-tRNA(Gln) and/or aspartyl-tRNA(Asn) amidotransferase, subunit [Candidatus Saccharibacteria bacterium]